MKTQDLKPCESQWDGVRRVAVLQRHNEYTRIMKATMTTESLLFSLISSSLVCFHPASLSRTRWGVNECLRDGINIPTASNFHFSLTLSPKRDLRSSSMNYQREMWRNFPKSFQVKPPIDYDVLRVEKWKYRAEFICFHFHFALVGKTHHSKLFRNEFSTPFRCRNFLSSALVWFKSTIIATTLSQQPKGFKGSVV